MRPIQFEGSIEIKKPHEMSDEECLSVWAAQVDHVSGGKVWIEAWQPSYEDIQAINRGEPIYLILHQSTIPPIGMFTLDEDGKSNDIP